MAERAKGNILYEILIVVLVVGLIAAILYPSHVWKNETAMESVCRARMDALYQLELSYRLSEADTYTDSVALLKEYVVNTPMAYSAMDSLIKWDQLVPADQLEALVLGLDMPTDLRNLMLATMNEKEPLKNLGQWDDLGVKLITAFSEKLANLDEAAMEALAPGVSWPVVLGEDNFFNLLRSQDVPTRIATRTITEVTRQGKPLHETGAWNRYYRDRFFAALVPVVEEALRTDIWFKVDEDAWEVQRRAAWEADLDAMTDVEKDSLWEAEKRRFWDKESEIYWMKERRKLWKAEQEVFAAQNEDIWKRNIETGWVANRKIDYLKELRDSPELPDSLRQVFMTVRDSLWNLVVDSIRTNEYPVWYVKNEKEHMKVVEKLWEGERRITWDEEAYPAWIESEKQSEDYWQKVKDRLWKRSRPSFWADEEAKKASRTGKRNLLDSGVKWVDALGQEQIEAIVNGLNLPDAPMLWEKVAKNEKEYVDGAVFYGFGIQDLFKDMLIDSIFSCPTAMAPYHIEVIDTSAIKYVSVFCPIEEREGGAVALKVDPVTKDTTEINIAIPANVKFFGGGEVKNHGNIKEEKRSWDKN